MSLVFLKIILIWITLHQRSFRYIRFLESKEMTLRNLFAAGVPLLLTSQSLSLLIKSYLDRYVMKINNTNKYFSIHYDNIGLLFSKIKIKT